MNDEVLHAYVRNKLQAGRTVNVIIRGTSMLPNLQDGQECVVAPLSQVGKPAFGDLVLIEWGSCGYVVHRLIWPRTGRTKGDNLDMLDPKSQDIRIVGKVISPSNANARRIAFLSLLRAALSYVDMHISRWRKNEKRRNLSSR